MNVTWNDSLATGIPEVDDQHRELIRRLNTFLDSCDSGRDKDELVEMLAFLDEYVEEHFTEEEKMQERYHYSGLGKHRMDHRLFIERLTDFKKRFIREGPTPALVADVSRFTVRWLIHHIAGEDMRFAGEARTGGRRGKSSH